MNETKRLPGRARINDVHQSWLPYVVHFDPTNPERSQGAFCRWAGLSTSYVSSAKNNPITEYIEFKLSQWIEEKAKEAPTLDERFEKVNSLFDKMNEVLDRYNEKIKNNE